MPRKTMLETLLQQAAGLLELTHNTVQGCRLFVDARTIPEVDEDLVRVQAHIRESQRVLRYLGQAAAQAREAQADSTHDPWEEEDE